MSRPFQKIRGHVSSVESVAFFNDNRRVVTCSIAAFIWDVQTGTLIGEAFKGHRGTVFSVAVSPDNSQIATGGADRTSIIWDVESNEKVLGPLVKHTGGVWSVCFSPDGKRLASGSHDSTVVVWDAVTGAIVATLEGHRNWVMSVAFSPDGLKLASGSTDHTIRVWDTNNAELLLDINAHEHWVRSVVWSPDGQQLVSASDDKTIKFWDASTGHEIGQPCTGHTNVINSLAISSDGSFIASASREGSARIWSTNTYQQIVQPFTYAHSVLCVAISPNGELLAHAFGESPPTLYIWSIKDMLQEAKEISPGAMLQDITKSITKLGDYPVARGGFGEVWKCIYTTDQGQTDVAVKALLVYESDQLGEGMEKKTKRIQRELRTCAGLKHPNILPVYGYTHGFGLLMAIVCPWAEKGNLTTYLEHEDATLTFVRRFQILRDIVFGLKYLHTNHVIHGDLTGPNVLIHGDGTACLADFGLSLVYSEVITASAASWSSAFHGNFRWLAPELIGQADDDLPVRPSKYSDIYSFGGVMLQVLTSKIPYYYLPGDAAVAISIYSRVKPSRSKYPGISDKHWYFIEQCWSEKDQDRPSTERVVEVIDDEFDSLSSSTSSGF